MKKARVNSFNVLALCFFVILFALVGAMAFYNITVFAVSVALAVVLLISYALFKGRIYKSMLRGISAGAYQMAKQDAELLDEASNPIMVISKNGNIVWINKACAAVISREKTIGEAADRLLGVEAMDRLIHFKSAEFALEDKIFKAFSVGKEEMTVYMIDQTSLKKAAAEYRFSRPVVALLEIDALDEILKGERSSKRVQLISKIQEFIEAWFSPANGIIVTLTESTYMMVFEKRYLEKFEAIRFSIIDLIREFGNEENKQLTASIGVGYGCKSLQQCQQLAQEALDMALSRGGDQAAIKSLGADYRFYGGVKSAQQKGSRVRARVTAHYLKEAVVASSRVMVMCHKFSDFDGIGAALGICYIAKYLGVHAEIVVDENNSMAKSLFEMIRQSDMKHTLIPPEQAIKEIDSNTLLVIVDTHRPSFVESKQLYEMAERVIVIDHHRRATDYISNAAVFYNETVSSSTCEIITELWQYIAAERLEKTGAEALLAGIMLDTKGFVLNTGARTYEASAYLSKCQADPVAVKKLFADSLETEKGKYSVISSAQDFMGCAISVCDADVLNARLISAQAADELLDVEGVKASFVLYEAGGTVNISARSYGEVNVHLITEMLGGGGHRTMAGAAVKGSCEAVVEKLKNKIQEYFSER